jgi:hypothetical protein
MGFTGRETIVRYLCLLVGEPGMEGPVPGTPEFMQMLSDYESATKAMAAAGVLVDSGPLQPAGSATTIRVRDSESLVTDGPFAELKEQIGGYYVLDCADLDEALRWSALALDPPPAEREFLTGRLSELLAPSM